MCGNKFSAFPRHRWSEKFPRFYASHRFLKVFLGRKSRKFFSYLYTFLRHVFNKQAEQCAKSFGTGFNGVFIRVSSLNWPRGGCEGKPLLRWLERERTLLLKLRWNLFNCVRKTDKNYERSFDSDRRKVSYSFFYLKF